MTQPNIVIYQAPDGGIELRGDFKRETVWASQSQIVDIFGIDQSVVSRHIRNILKDGEVDEKSNMQKMHIANSDKPVVFYSLDVILAVGYRANSKVAIHFRKWATQTLRQHITQGYTVNKKILSSHYDKFQKALSEVQKLLPKNTAISHDDILELVKSFAGTWFSLESYDREQFPKKGFTKKILTIQGKQLYLAVDIFKQDLITKEQATELFAEEKQDGALEGILGNIFQSVFGKDVYETVEEKAAHLLYFVIKNHPFNDGNKRTGAFAFVWFLQKSGIAYRHKITPEALTAITLLVAESKPSDKDRMIGIVLLLMSK